MQFCCCRTKTNRRYVNQRVRLCSDNTFLWTLKSEFRVVTKYSVSHPFKSVKICRAPWLNKIGSRPDLALGQSSPTGTSSRSLPFPVRQPQGWLAKPSARSLPGDCTLLSHHCRPLTELAFTWGTAVISSLVSRLPAFSLHTWNDLPAASPRS